MNSKTLIVPLENLNSIIDQHILPIAQPGAIFLLSGQLGAGKTTLVKALLSKLGITDEITSPTFSYVNSYENEAKTLTIHHFDLYRLGSVDEFVMQGFDELIQQKNALSIVEWPEILSGLFDKKQRPATIFKLELQHDFTKPEARLLVIS